MLIVTVPGVSGAPEAQYRVPVKPPMAKPKSMGLHHVMGIRGTKMSLS